MGSQYKIIRIMYLNLATYFNIRLSEYAEVRKNAFVRYEAEDFRFLTSLTR